jgi:hypothetical protein
MESAEQLLSALQGLAGQDPPLMTNALPSAVRLLDGKTGIGYGQFNELLLLLGYDRVTHAFFQYLVDGTTTYLSGSALLSLAHLSDGVERFQKLALLCFGNVKYAFKRLSRDADDLRLWLTYLQPIPESDFHDRHEPVFPVVPIPPADTYYLGYLIQGDIAYRLKKNPQDPQALAEEEKRSSIVDTGKQNHHAYLASDHLDVYVATSMRERHEYLQISELTAEIFRDVSVRDLKLRWFDPTQAYCDHRIDKGLAEALMLKRAKCTLYLAQEVDTLGKDSELASTLAQGKPVIAYIPAVDSVYSDRLISRLRTIYTTRTENDLLLAQLQVFAPRAAWSSPEVRRWLDDPAAANTQELRDRLTLTMREHYDKRAKLLRDDHPLGIQVNLATGVANGVLVVRSISDCAHLIRGIVTNRLSFSLDRSAPSAKGLLLLREDISKSVFRLVTGDAMLTNAFWNFYLEPAE